MGTSEKGNHGSIVANKPPVKRAASINSTDEFDPRGQGRLTYDRRRNGGEVISSSSKRMCELIILELISSIIEKRNLSTELYWIVQLNLKMGPFHYASLQNDI